MQLRTPVNPIRYNGDATVVSCGSTNSSKMMLSNPTTLTCDGTSIPSRPSPLTTPIANWSLYACTAVDPNSATRSAALNPASTVGSQGPIRRTSSPSSLATFITARHRVPSDQDVSGPATYVIRSCPSRARCSTDRRIPRSASMSTQLASGMTRLSSTTAFCLATIRNAESVIRELAMTSLSTCPSSCSMVCRSTFGDSLVCDSISWNPASRAASYAPLMMSP